MRKIKSLLAVLVSLALTAFLSACGGSTGFPPVITAVNVQSLSFGRTATIYLGGKDLRASLVVDSGGGCINPSFASNSTTDVLVLNCLVKTVGDIRLTIKTASGDEVHTTSITVPKPQVTLVTSKGAIILELDPIKAPITTNNFLSYVASGFYKDTLFHRVISGFVFRAAVTPRAW